MQTQFARPCLFIRSNPHSECVFYSVIVIMILLSQRKVLRMKKKKKLLVAKSQRIILKWRILILIRILIRTSEAMGERPGVRAGDLEGVAMMIDDK